MEEQLREARKVLEEVNYKKDYSASFFETTIRHLGGLLGAYELSKDDIYLQKAIELGDVLLPAFDSPTGIPYSVINLMTGEAKNLQWTSGASILSELGQFN
jgi:uncharacterized protein YyaL (SSP411 family)